MNRGGGGNSSRAVAAVLFLLELLIYALLVTGYFFLVLHFLEGRLKDLFQTSKTAYAFLAIGLMVGQGVLLQAITTAMVGFFRRRLGRG